MTSSEILLFHHTDKLVDMFPAHFSDRPMFLWYADRYCHFLGTDTYTYLFLVNPVRDGIELRTRARPQNFDTLHKNMLHYKGWREGAHPEWCGCGRTDNKYEESGIVMTFSQIKPDLVLIARSYGSSLDEWKQVTYEIIFPYQPFSKRVIRLFEGPYENDYECKPIRFDQIPEIVELLPSLPEALNFQDLKPDANGIYHWEDWVDMSDYKPNATWL